MTVTRGWRMIFAEHDSASRRSRSGGLSLTGIRLHASFAAHPGKWLNSEIIIPHRLTVTQAAHHPNVTRQAMSAPLTGHAGLSATMAIRFEKAFGKRADTLLRMQAAHDLMQARAHKRDINVERVPVAA